MEATHAVVTPGDANKIVPDDNTRVGDAAVLGVRSDRGDLTRIPLNECHGGGAAAERFEAHRAGPGKPVEYT
jgi:hypothetical protein